LNTFTFLKRVTDSEAFAVCASALAATHIETVAKTASDMIVRYKLVLIKILSGSSGGFQVFVLREGQSSRRWS
jgi:uncharacterized protein (UPF0333 family)